jgi:long-chain acyl-CoA synthetase
LQAPQLRFLSVAGSPLTLTLKDEVEATFGLPLHNGYGLTECSPTLAQTRIESPRSDCAVGQPIPGVEVRLVGPSGQPVAGDEPGEVGELWVRSPGLMRGYYRDAAATAAAIDAEGWFNTGDMVRREADGALNIVGRSKELIIRSGLNVYPVEVEQALNSHPDVVQSAVVGRTVGHNEQVVAFVEAETHSTLAAPELARHLRERLAAYKLPSEIHFLDALPAAPTGKVLKNVLQKRAQAAADAASSPRPEGEST